MISHIFFSHHWAKKISHGIWSCARSKENCVSVKELSAEFDVLKTSICPRSQASRTNKLVLRKLHFHGATIRPIAPRQTPFCLYCSPPRDYLLSPLKLIFFCAVVQKSYWIISYFSRRKPWKPNVKFENETTQKLTFLTQFQLFYLL